MIIVFFIQPFEKFYAVSPVSTFYCDKSYTLPPVSTFYCDKFYTFFQKYCFMENNNIHLMPAMNSEDRAALRERQNSLLNDVPFPLNPVDPLTEDDDWNTDDEISSLSLVIDENTQSSTR